MYLKQYGRGGICFCGCALSLNSYESVYAEHLAVSYYSCAVEEQKVGVGNIGKIGNIFKRNVSEVYKDYLAV